MKRKVIRDIIIVFLFCPFLFSSLYAVDDAVYDTIMQRLQVNEWEEVADVSKLNSTAAGLLNTVKPDGSWVDIDYNSTAMTNWPSTIHLDRILDLSIAYTLASSSYYQNSTVYQNIESALQFFYNRNPISNNWYVHKIGVPQRLGRILILMRSGAQQVSQSLETNILNRIRDTGGNPVEYTGANKVDVGVHWVYRGCLTKDQAVLALGVNEVYEPIYMTTLEGLQHDYSYFQHGQQLYTGGYAIPFVRNTITIAGVAAGTEFALSEEKLTLMVTFFRDHVLSLLRGSTFLYSTVGRGIAIPGGIGGSFVASVASKFKKVDPEHQAVYDAALERLSGAKPGTYQVPEMHYHYWRGDYSLTSSPNYTFDIRMASTRTARSENGNGENLKGYFLTEGANAIVIEGNEYRNIFPVWDWARIPGTTVPQKAIIPRPTQWEKPGNSIFAGGVSNGKYGVTTYSMDNPDFNVNTQAKKSWFMFGEEIVCIGAGIKSTATEEINTTVNQCMQNGAAVVKHNNSETYIQIGSTSSYTDKLDWIHHNKIAYFFPADGNVNLYFGPQSGNWQSITSAQSATTLTSNVFKLWINHGVKPNLAKYQYIIVPNKTLSQTRAYDESNIVVAMNTHYIQAVFNKKLNLWGIVFYAAATFEQEDFSITVDAPCVMMVQNVGSSNVDCWLADPSQNTSTVNVRYTHTLFDYDKELSLNLPKIPNSGSTVHFSYNVSTSNEEIIHHQQKNQLSSNFINRGETAFLIYQADVAQQVMVKVIDLSGKVIVTKTFHFGMEEQKIPIETSALNPGMYFVYTLNSRSEIRRNPLIVR